MCEVTVNNYEGHVMSGDVSHPAVEDRRAFYNEFELREKIGGNDRSSSGTGKRTGSDHFTQVSVWKMEIIVLQPL